jgi:hypothetical protein
MFKILLYWRWKFGGLENKDFSAMALLCCGFFGCYVIGEFGAWCAAAISGYRGNRRHRNRTRDIASFFNLIVDPIDNGFPVHDLEKFYKSLGELDRGSSLHGLSDSCIS